MQQSISVFVPAYNEEENIHDVAVEINDYLIPHFADYEILIISEGSADRTNEIVKELQKDIPRLRLLARPENFGYAGALRTGFKNSKKDLIFYTDGDRQFDIKELDHLIPLIEKYDIVTGYKIKRHDPLMRIWTSKIYNWTMRLLFGLKVKDVNCAFKLYKKEVIDKVEFLPNLTQGVINVEVYLTALKNGFTIGEVGVHHFHRAGGQSGAEIGGGGKIFALVRPRVIWGFIKDTFSVWRKFYL